MTKLQFGFIIEETRIIEQDETKFSFVVNANGSLSIKDNQQLLIRTVSTTVTKEEAEAFVIICNDRLYSGDAQVENEIYGKHYYHLFLRNTDGSLTVKSMYAL